MDERSRLLERAEQCRGIAEKINHAETAQTLRKLPKEYQQQAESAASNDSHKRDGARR
jgi:hypothetical protein